MSAPRVIKRTPDLGIKVRLQKPFNASIDGVQWVGGYVERTGDEYEGYQTNAPSFRTDGVRFDGAGRLVYCTLHPQDNWRLRTVIGIPVGDAVFGVSWTWDLDVNPLVAEYGIEPMAAVKVKIIGQFIYVTIDAEPLNAWEIGNDLMPILTLTATARGPGGTVGTLTLVVMPGRAIPSLTAL